MKSARRNLVFSSVVGGVLGITLLGFGLLWVVAAAALGTDFSVTAVLFVGLGAYLVWSSVKAWRAENQLARGYIPPKLQATLEFEPTTTFRLVGVVNLVVMLALIALVIAGVLPRWGMLIAFASGWPYTAWAYWQLHMARQRQRSNATGPAVRP